MMTRRHLIHLSLAALVLAGPALAGTDPLAAAFGALSPAARRAAQDQLAMAGFYRGPVDGAFGPATRKALKEAADFIAWNSQGKEVPDLGTPRGAAHFVKALARGDMARHLWGEGDETGD